jgi:hypothetical protein
MLSFSMEGRILEVKETLMSFHDTKVTYFYYDTEHWMVSSHGKKGDRPDCTMTPESIAWVKDHYLPKALAPKSGPSLQSAFDPKAKGRSAAVTASMEKDNFYEGHRREECGVEWRRRYDELKAADQTKSAGPAM